MKLISKSFDKIKDEFQIRITRLGFAFNEDVFSDTIIKCNNKLSSKTLTDTQMISYFWIAFKTNTLRDLRYTRNKTTDIIPLNIYTENSPINEIFEEVSKLIINKFGEELYELFVLHSNGATYEELSHITERKKLKYSFRRIREYVRKNYHF